MRNIKSHVLIVLIAFVILLVQMTAFSQIWSTIVSLAVEQGRTQRGGVAIGITILYGYYFFAPACLVASLFAGWVSSFKGRWIAILVCLGAWVAWLSPSFSEYPNRMSAFVAVGAFILLFGSGVLMPLVIRVMRTRATGRTN